MEICAGHCEQCPSLYCLLTACTVCDLCAGGHGGCERQAITRLRNGIGARVTSGWALPASTRVLWLMISSSRQCALLAQLVWKTYPIDRQYMSVIKGSALPPNMVIGLQPAGSAHAYKGRTSTQDDLQRPAWQVRHPVTSPWVFLGCFTCVGVYLFYLYLYLFISHIGSNPWPPLLLIQGKWLAPREVHLAGLAFSLMMHTSAARHHLNLQQGFKCCSYGYI